MRSLVSTRGVAILVAGVFAVGVGLVYATIPDTGLVIHACYKTIGGSVRIVEGAGDCGPSEMALQWSQSGPPGPAGPKGDTGATGASGQPGQTGTNGISVTSTPLAAGDTNCPTGGSLFTAVSGVTYACNGTSGGTDEYDTGDDVLVTAVTGTTPKTLASISVPAGNFLVFGRVKIDSLDSGYCEINAPAGTYDLVSGLHEGPVSLQAVMTQSGPVNVDLVCGNLGNPFSNGSVRDIRLSAISVAQRH